MAIQDLATPFGTAGVGRRGFLVSAVGGLTIGFFLPAFSRRAEAATGAGTQVNSWIQIGTDESVTITVGCAEMGQGSLSSLPQIVAEDLMVDYGKVRAVQAAASQAYFTGGSGSVRYNFWPLRNVGAAAREMLVQAAMNQLGDQNRANYQVVLGVVTNVVKKVSLTYGQLAPAAALLPPPTNPALVPDSQFQWIGKSPQRLDIPLKVDGSAIYGLDVRVPNMVYAVIRHSPAFGGTLAAKPVKPAGAIAVVPTQVIAGLDRGTEAVGNINGVAVVAGNTWDAWQMSKGLRVTWNVPSSNANLNSAQFLSQAQGLLTNATPYNPNGPNPAGTLYTVEQNGNVAGGLAGAAKVVDAQYSLPYLAHACMEVLNCTVDYRAGVSCTIWAPTQGAGVAAATVAQVTGLSMNQITVNTTYLGGGLGRKAEMDFISEAVQVAMAVGRPVKLMWPREEDYGRDQYRPMALVHAKAGINSSGGVVAWQYRNVSPSIVAQRGWPVGATGDSEATDGSTALPYAFGSLLTEYVTHPSPIPVGFWRSVGSSLNTFAVESLVDELALAAGQDPYAFRRALLTDARWIAVLDAATTLGKWSTKPSQGRARGLAIAKSFDSIVCQVVEISSSSAKSITVHHVACAIDCYRAVNPNSVQAQMEGGIVHALNAALWGQITFTAGKSSVHNFSDTRVMRIGDMPQVDITILPAPASMDPTAPIGGVGEPAVPPIAPALANAYAKLTGTRVRTLPFFPGARMSGL